MTMKLDSCKSLPTMREKIWSNDEYYIGETDKEKRRNGNGENHWTGAESVEWYNGHFTRDTMNGAGEYRWRYDGPQGAFITYEGWFYANRMHGYGSMSYPDGRTFTGLYHENCRWGPGIEAHVTLHEDVGFWRGSQLIRLAWRPEGPCVGVDLMTGCNGKAFVEPFRIMLAHTSKTIGETNSAIELLKSYGADPLLAAEVWPKLYVKHGTDLQSQACHVERFEHDYYKRKVASLQEVTSIPEQIHDQDETVDSQSDNDIKSLMYFAWNNSETMVHIMKHCYKHEEQSKSSRIELAKILNGPRKHFRPAGIHERNCRTLLMASYVGQINIVAQLINEQNVHSDLADMHGNTALMYATCGDQADITHFLAEAGANMNSYNDSCCTPLGVALLRYACLSKEVAPTMMVQALLPPQVPSVAQALVLSSESNTNDWKIHRESPDQELNRAAQRSINKGEKKMKSTIVLRDSSATRKKTEAIPLEREYESQDSFSKERVLYSTISNEFSTKVNNLSTYPNLIVPYIFEVHDMAVEVETNGLLPKPLFSLNKNLSKQKPIKERESKVIWLTNTDDGISENIEERLKTEMLTKMMLTILQLLSDGADPRLVRCPKPALFIAIIAGSSDLVRHLAHYGADINESYPETRGYTALDIAISRPFTSENVEVVRALLENGADANQRLPNINDMPGPTLLHAVLARKIENLGDDDILHDLIGLLLDYNCNPATQFNGHSAVDMAMIKNLELLDTFIKNRNTNLNEVINSSNQTALIKIFSLPYLKQISGTNRIPILTNLLLYGADPLIKCHDGETNYDNVLVFAKKILKSMNTEKHLSTGSAKGSKNSKADPKKSKLDTKEKTRKSNSEASKGKPGEISDYKVALDLVAEYARMLHIKWLQAKIMKELISIIYRFKHRQWNMILKEHKDLKSVGLWLKAQRCLEIWDILKTTKRKLYKDEHILKHLLYIVQFCSTKSKLSRSTYEINPTMTAIEKRNIETDVRHLLIEHQNVSKFKETAESWKHPCAKPELAEDVDEKFNICLECSLPLTEDIVLCTSCRLVSFCSIRCMKVNVDRPFCHPCSVYLKEIFSEELQGVEEATEFQDF